jgi:hypothetical protein
MDRWFYFSRVLRFRLIFLFFIVAYIVSWWLILPIFIFLAIVFFLFRRKQLDFTARRALDNNLVLSPVSGIVEKVDGDLLELKVNLLDDYGFYMPFYGEIKTFLQEKGKGTIEFFSDNIDYAIFEFNIGSTGPKIYVDSGDKASAGAYLGYFPFGGKMKLKLPSNSEIQVKKGDILQSGQTILASI